MSTKPHKRIFWAYNSDDLNHLPAWLDFRMEHVTNALIIEHSDTGASSICLFNGDDEAGIIRCANDDICDMVFDLVSEAGIEPVYGQESDKPKFYRNPTPMKKGEWR